MRTEKQIKEYRKNYYARNKIRLRALGRKYHNDNYVKKGMYKGIKIKRCIIQYGIFKLNFD